MIANGIIYSGVQISRRCPIDRSLKLYNMRLEQRELFKTLLSMPGLDKKRGELIDKYLDTFPWDKKETKTDHSFEDIWRMIKEEKND
jgi:hypothetical protein